ncbi:MAG: hypothetical protein LBR69_00895 [Endomicrobium sp.]|jgi:type IV pilus assembly protein PilQ|nr:hypothetical protein [Endomicrobium sp.]
MMKKSAVLVISVLLLVQTVFAAPATGRGNISVDFQGTTLYTVLNVLSMKTGRKFITDADLLNKKIVLTLKDVTPDEAINALLDTYDLYYVRQGDTDIYVIKSKSDVSPITVSKVLFCNYAKAEALSKVLEARLTRGGKITFDERTNSLIVTDLADTIDKIEILVRSLDVPTPQVQIEAKIVDVTLSNRFQIGTQIDNIYRAPKVNVTGLSSAGQYITQSNINTPPTITDVPGGVTVSPTDIYGRGTINTSGYFWADPLDIVDGVSYRPTANYQHSLSNLTNIAGVGRLSTALIAGDYNILGSFYAGIQDTNAKVLTNPKLIVLNNQEAEIDIVEEVPYISGSSINENGSITTTTAFKEVGLKLKVKPQINRDGTIVLSVVPEQSFRTAETLDGVPVINVSKANTVMILRSGETAVIGGLIRETENETVNKIPLLGDIPILGYLFKTVSKDKVRHELTIFISAKILN